MQWKTVYFIVVFITIIVLYMSSNVLDSVLQLMNCFDGRRYYRYYIWEYGIVGIVCEKVESRIAKNTVFWFLHIAPPSKNTVNTAKPVKSTMIKIHI